MQPMNNALKLGFLVLVLWLIVSRPFDFKVGLVPTQDDELG